MTSVPPEPFPGSMTVPLLFGWENILVVLVVLVAVAVVFFLASAAGTGSDSRSEWQAGLEARSRDRLDAGVRRSDPRDEPLVADRDT